MTGPLSRFAVAVLILTPLGAAPVAAETGAYVDVRPIRALRLASAAPGPRDFPASPIRGVQPPDLTARDPAPEPQKMDPPPAETASAPAPSAAEADAPPASAPPVSVQSAVDTPAAAAPLAHANHAPARRRSRHPEPHGHRTWRCESRLAHLFRPRGHADQDPAPSARNGPLACGTRVSTTWRRCRTRSSSMAGSPSMPPRPRTYWAVPHRTAASVFPRRMPAPSMA